MGSRCEGVYFRRATRQCSPSSMLKTTGWRLVQAIPILEAVRAIPKSVLICRDIGGGAEPANLPVPPEKVTIPCAAATSSTTWPFAVFGPIQSGSRTMTRPGGSSPNWLSSPFRSDARCRTWSPWRPTPTQALRFGAPPRTDRAEGASERELETAEQAFRRSLIGNRPSSSSTCRRSWTSTSRPLVEESFREMLAALSTSGPPSSQLGTS
jgi:hypothetical protein